MSTTDVTGTTGSRAVDFMRTWRRGRGDYIEHSWRKFLVDAKGKPNANLMFLVSALVYWYSPAERSYINEHGEEVKTYSRKFKDKDYLQLSIEQVATIAMVGRSTAKKLLEQLETMGLIKRHYRNLIHRDLSGNTTQKATNVMYIEFFPWTLKTLMDKYELEGTQSEDSYYFETVISAKEDDETVVYFEDLEAVEITQQDNNTTDDKQHIDNKNEKETAGTEVNTTSVTTNGNTYGTNNNTSGIKLVSPIPQKHKTAGKVISQNLTDPQSKFDRQILKNTTENNKSSFSLSLYQQEDVSALEDLAFSRKERKRKRKKREKSLHPAQKPSRRETTTTSYTAQTERNYQLRAKKKRKREETTGNSFSSLADVLSEIIEPLQGSYG